MGFEDINCDSHQTQIVMKRIIPFIIVSSVAFIFSLSLTAQTTQKHLNQVELHKQLYGKWEYEIGKDTIYSYEATEYGKGAYWEYNISTGEEILMEGIAVGGYSAKYDKFIYTSIDKGKDAQNISSWFTTPNKLNHMNLEFISNPENAPWRIETEIVDSDTYVEKVFVNNEYVETKIWTRIKQ